MKNAFQNVLTYGEDKVWERVLEFMELVVSFSFEF